MSGEIHSSSPEETERTGAALAATLAPGDVVLVSGELGAGKTTFVRGAARALGVTEPVTSPTFVVGHLYDAGVAHLDLYRLAGPAELPELSLQAPAAHEVWLVEWPERGGDDFPSDLQITLEQGPGADARIAHLLAGPRWRDRRMRSSGAPPPTCCRPTLPSGCWRWTRRQWQARR